LQRLKKVIFMMIAGISLLVSIGMAALWGRSFRYYDRVRINHTWEFAEEDSVIGSVGGRFMLSRDWTRHLGQSPSPQTSKTWREANPLLPGDAANFVHANESLFAQAGWCWWGFGSMHKSYSQNRKTLWVSLPTNNVIQEKYDIVAVPDWAIILLALILPARFIWIRLGRRHRRAHPGFCANCGYDLRATPDRCPECGREVLPVRE
jgi:hypothetical protein